MNFHNELNPKIWNKDNTLKDEVYDKLTEITEAFLEYIDIPEEAVTDVRLVGSSANYNYTPHSDLDVHVIVDYDKVHEDCPVVEGYLWSMKSQFNKEHDINIYKIPVEMYAEDSRVEAISNGSYSIMNDEWIRQPEKIEPTDNDVAVEAKYNELKEAIEKCNDSEVAQELQDKIYQMRKAGLAKEGEFSTENLAFKKLRNEGLMDKLKQLKKEKIDKQLSLESYNESNDKHTLDLSFEDESGWLNHIMLDLDDELYEDIEKYNIEFTIDKHTIDELEKYKEHLIDRIDDDMRNYVDDALVLTAFYDKDNYYSTLLFDGGDDDVLLSCLETLVDKIKKEMDINESIKEDIELPMYNEGEPYIEVTLAYGRPLGGYRLIDGILYYTGRNGTKQIGKNVTLDNLARRILSHAKNVTKMDIDKIEVDDKVIWDIVDGFIKNESIKENKMNEELVYTTKCKEPGIWVVYDKKTGEEIDHEYTDPDEATKQALYLNDIHNTGRADESLNEENEMDIYVLTKDDKIKLIKNNVSNNKVQMSNYSKQLMDMKNKGEIKNWIYWNSNKSLDFKNNRDLFLNTLRNNFKESKINEDNYDDLNKYLSNNRYLVKFIGREDEVVYAPDKEEAKLWAEQKYDFPVKEVTFIDNNLERLEKADKQIHNENKSLENSLYNSLSELLNEVGE